MADDNSIKIDLDLTTNGFETAIAQATKSADGFTKGLDKATQEASKGLDNAGAAGKKAGKDAVKTAINWTIAGVLTKFAREGLSRIFGRKVS